MILNASNIMYDSLMTKRNGRPLNVTPRASLYKVHLISHTENQLVPVFVVEKRNPEIKFRLLKYSGVI